jgi:hypothetical protein
LNTVNHEDAGLAGRLLRADRELADATFYAARVAATSAGDYALLKQFVQYSFIEAVPIRRGE